MVCLIGNTQSKHRRNGLETNLEWTPVQWSGFFWYVFFAANIGGAGWRDGMPNWERPKQAPGNVKIGPKISPVPQKFGRGADY